MLVFLTAANSFYCYDYKQYPQRAGLLSLKYSEGELLQLPEKASIEQLNARCCR